MEVSTSDLLASLTSKLSRRELAQVRAHATDVPGAADELHTAIDRHAGEIAAAARTNEFLDTRLARALVAAFHQLVDSTTRSPHPERVLVHAAVYYFADPEDSDHDLRSPIGLEDDARVLNAVAQTLGLDELTIAIPD